MDFGNVIESVNFFTCIVAAYVGWRIYRWHQRSDLDEFTKKVICALAWVFAGIGISAGWFAVSRFLHLPDGDHWHALMYEWRWLLVTSTKAMIAWGALSFVALIDETSMLKKYLVFAAAVIAAGALGFSEF